MKLLRNYIQNFLSRAGSAIFTATVLARFLSLFASWVALQFVLNSKLGVVLFAYSIIIFVLPMGGGGLQQSLLRFGALLKTDEEKNSLFVYVFKNGILVSLVLILLLIGVCYFISFRFENSFYYVAFLSISILPAYVFELIKIQFRLQYNNKLFAFSELIFTVFLVFFVTLFSYYYQEKGYAVALVLSPLFSCLFFIKKLKINFSKTKKLTITGLSFWKYGFFASLSNVATQLLLVIDILLIGYLLNDAEMVTNYKYLSLIPLSLVFIPRIFINADFVYFTENIRNKKYIATYIKSYLLLFSLVSTALGILFWFIYKPLLNFFDPSFDQYKNTFFILLFGVMGILILRGLFGNLLSSIGKAHINFYIVSIAIVLNITGNFYLIPIYGITGAAITSAALMWLTGIVAALAFWIIYNHGFLKEK